MSRPVPKPNLPPIKVPKQPCNHKWMHLDTKKYYENRDFNTKFTRIDNFYCENCCEIKTITKEDYTRNEPDWY